MYTLEPDMKDQYGQEYALKEAYEAEQRRLEEKREVEGSGNDPGEDGDAPF